MLLLLCEYVWPVSRPHGERCQGKIRHVAGSLASRFEVMDVNCPLSDNLISNVRGRIIHGTSIQEKPCGRSRRWPRRVHVPTVRVAATSASETRPAAPGAPADPRTASSR